MSENLDSNVTPEATLRFSVEDLYEAGKRLGPVQSSLTPPKTTFEDLHRRADALAQRMHEREARQIAKIRKTQGLIGIAGFCLLLVSLLLSRE